MRRIAKPMAFVVGMLLGLASFAVTYTLRPHRHPPRTVTVASGLSFVDFVEGSGVRPSQGQLVTVEYIGTLEGGGLIDRSSDSGRPFEFRLGTGQVIRGFDEGIMTMKVGGKRRLIIPPSMGYGTRGLPGKIPPNATLIFDVELLSVGG